MSVWDIDATCCWTEQFCYLWLAVARPLFDYSKNSFLSECNTHVFLITFLLDTTGQQTSINILKLILFSSLGFCYESVESVKIYVSIWKIEVY